MLTNDARRLYRTFVACVVSTCATLIYLSFVTNESSKRLVKPVSRNHLYPSNWSVLNLKHVEFLINSDVCAGLTSVDLLITVTSHPGHAGLRQAFRRALPKDQLVRYKMARVFHLARINERQSGYAQVNETLIEDEHDAHGDIVQSDFLESYRNLTYKHVTMLQHAAAYCPQARYLLKMDDDVAVDLFQILNLTRTVFNDDDDAHDAHGAIIVGRVMVGAERSAVRDSASKWCVTYDEYPPDSYPAFVSGWAYVTTLATAAKLASLARHWPYFWIDDVFVTGLVAGSARVRHADLRSVWTTDASDARCCVQAPDDVACNYFVAPTDEAGVGGAELLIESFYRKALRCHLSACTASDGRLESCQRREREKETRRVVEGQVIALN